MTETVKPLNNLRKDATAIGMGWTWKNGFWHTANGEQRGEKNWDPVFNEQHAMVLLVTWYVRMVNEGSAVADTLVIRMIGNGSKEEPFEWHMRVTYKGRELVMIHKNYGSAVVKLLAEHVWRIDGAGA